ncbi:hypothetical protein ATANTOWER_026076 [Ataeniobius toweri]|uniref:Uncharacterized protein n=1 Tax=Ataeniobius toweri TaxID=208326 RepID=A0ABU7B8Y8_9TELE|nr:hypothetical protein [Ataeniobius toweri]
MVPCGGRSRSSWSGAIQSLYKQSMSLLCIAGIKSDLFPVLLHIQRSHLRWLRHLFRMTAGHLPRKVFQATSHREEAQSTAQDMLEGLCLSAGLGTTLAFPRGAGGGVWGEGSLGVCLDYCPRDPVADKRKTDEYEVYDAVFNCSFFFYSTGNKAGGFPQHWNLLLDQAMVEKMLQSPK